MSSVLALRANRFLSEQLVTGDATVEMVIDRRSGDAFIRVNGSNKNIHAFAQACPPSLPL